jgi:radical SAM superfamily enzyme YgiQ (UPF0313 family)
MRGCAVAAQTLGVAGAILVSPYELGRQPFSLAHAAAWLSRAGFTVTCIDLSQQRLDATLLSEARYIALYLGMHTATRIAAAALPKLRVLAPTARLGAFGLYAPMNAELLDHFGVEAIFGGESEPDLLDWLQGRTDSTATPVVRRSKIEFLLPDRTTLPSLACYARLWMPDGSTRVIGSTEASRGCKHLCRHCPVVPVYEGRFRIVPVDVVIADIAQQVAAGARHISFGDPDFLNGPTHARNVAQALHERFPDLTWDATIKIEHLIRHADLLPRLKQLGLLFVVSAVESLDDAILNHLAKGHTCADFKTALATCRELGIALAPTFVPFTPWTTMAGYLGLLATLVELDLVEAVPSVQLAIRLLVPRGSHLMKLPDFAARVGAFDSIMLGYPWRSDDPRVDALQKDVLDWVKQAEKIGRNRGETFIGIWQRTHAALGLPAPPLSTAEFGRPIPHHSEPWYCCAEPTDTQFANF